MKFPLKAPVDSVQIPEEAVCLICRNEIGEVKGFIRLAAGAILFHDKKRTCGGPSDMMDTVFSLWYHGPHHVSGYMKDGRPIIGMNNHECELDVVEPMRGGQVDILFCSTSCLSQFFNAVVGQFEKSIQQTIQAGENANDRHSAHA